MDDIFDSLTQAIEEAAFPYFYARPGYRREQYRIEQHMQWLSEHLDAEALGRLEEMRKSEVFIDSLERKALIRMALAVGVRVALPGASTV